MRENRVKGPLDPTLHYWFKPVQFNKIEKIENNDVIECNDGFSVEEEDVDNYLLPVLLKHFDAQLPYNKERYDIDRGMIDFFGWYNTHNFYTYEVMTQVCEELETLSVALIANEDNEILQQIKENVEEFEAKVVVDFYHSFVTRVRLVMANNPDVNVISVVAP